MNAPPHRNRLANEKSTRAPALATNKPILRRTSLDQALLESERGELTDTPTIVVGKDWWTQLAPDKQSGYRKRAKRAGVTLRSDALLGQDYVVVRSPSSAELSIASAPPATQPAASPYKERQAR